MPRIYVPDYPGLSLVSSDFNRVQSEHEDRPEAARAVQSLYESDGPASSDGG